MEPKDRHRDIIDIEMISNRFKKHASLLMCLFFVTATSQHFLVWILGYMLCLSDHIPYESIAVAFLEQVRALEKREDAAKVLQIARDIKETLSLQCLL